MLDLVFRSASFIAQFAFPVFASYKALESNDISLLRPWLMYWVVIAIQLLAEFYLGAILSWVPFYYFFRFLFALWLVLPQFQGATLIYLERVEPFLKAHESDVDLAISRAHSDMLALASGYVRKLVDYVKRVSGLSLLLGREEGPQQPAGSEAKEEYSPSSTFSSLLGRGAAVLLQTDAAQATREPDAPAASSSYVDTLLARFRVPVDSSHVMAIVSSSVSALGSIGTRNLLYPSQVKSKNEKLEYLTEQRTKLEKLLKGLDDQVQVVKDEDDIHEFDGLAENEGDATSANDVSNVSQDISSAPVENSEPLVPAAGEGPASAKPWLFGRW